MGERVTQAELARRLEVSRQAIHDLIQRGLLQLGGDGKIDVWERFSPQGDVIRTGRDTNGDGKVDEREE